MNKFSKTLQARNHMSRPNSSHSLQLPNTHTTGSPGWSPWRRGSNSRGVQGADFLEQAMAGLSPMGWARVSYVNNGIRHLCLGRQHLDPNFSGACGFNSAGFFICVSNSTCKPEDQMIPLSLPMYLSISYMIYQYICFSNVTRYACII